MSARFQSAGGFCRAAATGCTPTDLHSIRVKSVSSTHFLQHALLLLPLPRTTTAMLCNEDFQPDACECQYFEVGAHGSQ